MAHRQTGRGRSDFQSIALFVNDYAVVADLTLAERSFIHVLHDIGGNLESIMRCELRLARTELREEFGQAFRGALMCGAAGLAGLLAIIFLPLAVQFALTRVMPDWAAALLIAASSAVCAGAALAAGTPGLNGSIRSCPRQCKA